MESFSPERSSDIRFLLNDGMYEPFFVHIYRSPLFPLYWYSCFSSLSGTLPPFQFFFILLVYSFLLLRIGHSSSAKFFSRLWRNPVRWLFLTFLLALPFFSFFFFLQRITSPLHETPFLSLILLQIATNSFSSQLFSHLSFRIIFHCFYYFFFFVG